MPACTSAMTLGQSTAARSAVVRATPARNRALDVWQNCTNCAAVIGFPLIHVDGSGKPLAPLLAFALVAVAIAESSIWSAAAMTAGYAERSGTTVLGVEGSTIAAESYTMA